MKQEQTKENKKLNLICNRRLEKYFSITEKALQIAKKNISKSKEKKQQAYEIIKMVECYLSDAKHFEKQNHYVNAFACINYAHGWLDCGTRLKIFNVKDNRLFSV